MPSLLVTIEQVQMQDMTNDDSGYFVETGL
jgi:hypothetical protein